MYEIYSQKFPPDTWELLTESGLAGPLRPNLDYPLSNQAGPLLPNICRTCYRVKFLQRPNSRLKE